MNRDKYYRLAKDLNRADEISDHVGRAHFEEKLWGRLSRFDRATYIWWDGFDTFLTAKDNGWLKWGDWKAILTFIKLGFVAAIKYREVEDKT